MPRKFRLSHKKSHYRNVSAETSNSDASCDVYTQTDDERDIVDVTTQTDSVDVTIVDDDDRSYVDAAVQTDMGDERKTVNVTTQTDEIQNLAVSSCSRATPQADALHLMSPMPGSCVIQYPLEIFYSLKLESVYQLNQRLRNAKCIDNWFVLPSDIQSEVIKLVKIDDRKVFTLEVLPDLQWVVCVPNK